MLEIVTHLDCDSNFACMILSLIWIFWLTVERCRVTLLSEEYWRSERTWGSLYFLIEFLDFSKIWYLMKPLHLVLFLALLKGFSWPGYLKKKKTISTYLVASYIIYLKMTSFTPKILLTIKVIILCCLMLYPEHLKSIWHIESVQKVYWLNEWSFYF